MGSKLTNVVAKGKRAKAIAENDPSIYGASAPAVSRVAATAPATRQTTSDNDALQIRARQRAEESPEGDLQRGLGVRKRKSK